MHYLYHSICTYMKNIIILQTLQRVSSGYSLSFHIEQACASLAPSTQMRRSSWRQTHTKKWPLWRNCLPLAISMSSTWWAASATPLPLSWSMPLSAISMTTSTNTRMRSVCVYCMGQYIRIHAVYMIVLHFIIRRTFISHLLCVYFCICIIHMQRLPGAAIRPPPSHVVEKFQRYYNTITLASLDMLTFANQIASGMVSEAKVTHGRCASCMLMNSSI